MNETLSKLVDWWYPNTSQIHSWNGFTICIVSSLAVYLLVIIGMSWEGELSYDNADELVDSTINLLVGLLLFLVVGIVIWFTAPVSLPIMFLVGTSMIFNKVGKTLDYTQTPKDR